MPHGDCRYELAHICYTMRGRPGGRPSSSSSALIVVDAAPRIAPAVRSVGRAGDFEVVGVREYIVVVQELADLPHCRIGQGRRIASRVRRPGPAARCGTGTRSEQPRATGASERNTELITRGAVRFTRQSSPSPSSSPAVDPPTDMRLNDDGRTGTNDHEQVVTVIRH